MEKHQFAAVSVTEESGETSALGFEASMEIWEELNAEGYIDLQGNVQDSLREALKENSLIIPAKYTEQRLEIENTLRKIAGRLEIKNANERCPVNPRHEVLQSSQFKALWDRIKHKTTYRVEFDNEKLLAECAHALLTAPPIPRTRLRWNKAELSIGRSGVEATETASAGSLTLDEMKIELPDLLTELQDRTQLTRRSIYRVLSESGRLDDFKRNPQKFIEIAAEAINTCKQLALVEGIKYQRIGNEFYYAQELFEDEELTGYLKNMIDSDKSVFEQVIFDSGIEAQFADDLEKNPDVKVYAKLPGWFTVPTPLGSYNPDWAVLVDTDEGERLYLVVETKGSLFSSALYSYEEAKIRCGKAHFDALQVKEASPQYVVATSVEDVFAEVDAN